MAAPPSQQPRRANVRLDRGLRRDVGKISLLFTGVGSIIGSGWLFSAMNASQIAGPTAIFSWIIGGAMILIIGLAYAELGVMFPVAGGVVRFPRYSFGSFAAYTMGWLSWLAAAAVPAIEVLAALQYSDHWLPGAVGREGPAGNFILTMPYGFLLAVGLMVVCCLINIVGVKVFARINNVMVWWKLGMIVLVIVALFAAAFHPGNLTDFGGFAPYGYDKMFGAIAIAGIAFSFLGFRQGVEFAGETDNPQKNVPFAIIGAVTICTALYVLLQIAFLTVLPPDVISGGWENLSFANDFGPLAGVALIFGMGWLAVLIYADAVISPGDTGVIYTAVTSRLAFSNGQNRNSPQWLTRLNRFGIPWLSVIVTFIAGCVFFLPFPGWQQMVGFVVSSTALSFGTGPLVVAAMRRQLPDQERPFKLPGGDIIPWLAFLCTNLFVVWTGWTTVWKTIVAVAIGFVIFVVHHNMNKSWTPPLELKSLGWILPWFAGLLAISLISGYGETGLALIPNWLSILLTAVMSVLVYWLALRTRLPSDRAAANVEQAPIQGPEQEEGASVATV